MCCTGRYIAGEIRTSSAILYKKGGLCHRSDEEEEAASGAEVDTRLEEPAMEELVDVPPTFSSFDFLQSYCRAFASVGKDLGSAHGRRRIPEQHVAKFAVAVAAGDYDWSGYGAEGRRARNAQRQWWH